MPKGVYERKPKGDTLRKGRPPKAGNSTYAALLAKLRQERGRLSDKVVALGTAIDALEEAEA